MPSTVGTTKTPTLPSRRLNFRKALRANGLRRIMPPSGEFEIVCLNWRLDDVTLIPTMRKPFDVLAEGLISQESRGERI